MAARLAGDVFGALEEQTVAAPGTGILDDEIPGTLIHGEHRAPRRKQTD